MTDIKHRLDKLEKTITLIADRENPKYLSQVEKKRFETWRIIDKVKRGEELTTEEQERFNIVNDKINRVLEGVREILHLENIDEVLEELTKNPEHTARALSLITY